MTLMDNAQLRELVDAPVERLDVEYKDWLDLDDKEAQAKLAKHFCALANHGGGFVVFGITDDMTPAGMKPAHAGPFDRDRMSSIVKRYLTPAFQVEVYDVAASATAIVHPVVWVPSHTAVPVCSLRAGPHDGRKPAGIEQATHYTRAVGPESVPVKTAEAWAPIIRRCVLRERKALLSGLEQLLRSPGAPDSEPEETLRRWYEAAHSKFLGSVDGDRNAKLFQRAHYQFTYRIDVADGQQLGMDDFLDELRKMGYEVMELVNTGWSMFQILNDGDLMPHWTVDEGLSEEEFLECDFAGLSSDHMINPELWRASPSGLATIVRAYDQDHREYGFGGAGLEAGTWFWPFGMAREIAEIIRHARAFAERFEAQGTVSFRAQWSGLRGRRLGDPRAPFVWRQSGTAQDDGRILSRTVPVASLTDAWPELTASMLAPILRMFGAGQLVSAQDIRTWSEKFRM